MSRTVPREVSTKEHTKVWHVPVWDVPIRLVHWLLVLLVATQWITAELDQWDLHKLSGYAVLVLLLFRIVWGFVGTRTARFASFVRGPAAVRAYAKSFWSRRAEYAIGHNPMGALSVLSMLAILLAQVTTGLFAMDHDTGLVSGPLAHLVSDDTAYLFTDLHEFLFNIVLTLIGLHIVVIFYYLWRKRENLVVPMVVGHKRFSVPHLSSVAQQRYALRALLVFALAVVAVVLLVTRL